jgi:hypothetical protein
MHLTSIWEVNVPNLGREPAILGEVSGGFSQFLQGNVGLVPRIRQRPLPSEYSSNRCSLNQPLIRHLYSLRYCLRVT